MLAQDILKKKSPEVITIGIDKTVYDAIALLIRHRIGALVVLNDNAEIVGIISERDIINVLYDNYKPLDTILIKNVMTKDVITGSPDDELEYIEIVMTQHHIRHLPINSQQGALIGMISIGDVIVSQLDQAKNDIKNWENKFYNKNGKF